MAGSVAADVLARIPLFVGLSKRSLRRVRRQMTDHRFDEGAVMVREGSRGETMFALVEGSARVVRQGRTLRRLGPGDVFGEIALFDRRPRSASVVAAEPVRALVLHRGDLRAIIEEEPTIAWTLLETMAGRLRGD
jgi:CRP-like cAMP-binding protein